jgi:hypothetical protein
LELAGDKEMAQIEVTVKQTLPMKLAHKSRDFVDQALFPLSKVSAIKMRGCRGDCFVESDLIRQFLHDKDTLKPRLIANFRYRDRLGCWNADLTRLLKMMPFIPSLGFSPAKPSP